MKKNFVSLAKSLGAVVFAIMAVMPAAQAQVADVNQQATDSVYQCQLNSADESCESGASFNAQASARVDSQNVQLAGFRGPMGPGRFGGAQGGCNVFGCYRPGGGCNAFGCYNPGGGCNAFGCYNWGGGCSAFGCW